MLCLCHQVSVEDAAPGEVDIYGDGTPDVLLEESLGGDRNIDSNFAVVEGCLEFPKRGKHAFGYDSQVQMPRLQLYPEIQYSTDKTPVAIRHQEATASKDIGV